MEYRAGDYRTTILTTSKKWYRCIIDECGHTFASERNCGLHILARHPQRFRCDIDDCGTLFDFRTPFAKHVSKQHQRFIQDGAFSTESASRQPPPKQRRTRKIPEGFVLVDIAPTLNPDSDKEPYRAEAPEDPSSTKGPLDTLFLEGKAPPEKISPIDDQAVIEWSKKRKASLPGDGLSNERIIRARYCKRKPEYTVPQSTKYPG
ncbi:MAG: hypothetical protein Q9226_002252 [Calogaya cf. arnoldii]